MYVMTVLVIALLSGYATADELSADTASSKTLAVVPVRNGKVDKNVYRQFDRLVPELKKISRTRIVKLECRYSGQPDREQDVNRAYDLAAQVEKYLRVRHKLDLDVWITVDITPKAEKAVPVLTLAVFSDDIKRLETVQINPPKKQQK